MRESARITVLALVTAVGLYLLAFQTRAEENDVWTPLQFLVGTWSGAGSGQPSDAMFGTTTFSYELDKRVMVRKNRAEYPPRPGEKIGQVHEDLLIIYPQPGQRKFRAAYFDNEGHVINYSASFPSKESSVVFDSELKEGSPRFRLVYEIARDSTLLAEFLVAPPGAELKSYARGTLRRQE